MKKNALLFVLALGLVFSACRRDDDDDTGNQNQLSGLAAFLNGEFNVEQVDYNGSLQTQLGNLPLSGTGENTVGDYNFKANAGTVDYQVATRIEVKVLTQTIPVPINVDGSGDIRYNSETQFEIDDPRYGLMTYNISNKTSSGLVATTRFQNDTLGGTLDILMDIYLERK